MLAKVIEARVRRGHSAAFLECQRIWHRECQKTLGYLGEISAETGEDIVTVITFWHSADDYEEWMSTDHDRIATLARSEEHYESISITLVPGPQLGS